MTSDICVCVSVSVWQGSEGRAGPQGNAGASGPRGERGPSGEAGIQGLAGRPVSNTSVPFIIPIGREKKCPVYYTPWP